MQNRAQVAQQGLQKNVEKDMQLIKQTWHEIPQCMPEISSTSANILRFMTLHLKQCQVLLGLHCATLDHLSLMTGECSVSVAGS